MMKTSEVHNIGETKAAFLDAQRKQAIKSWLLCMLALFVIFVLPNFVPAPFDQIVMGVGSATVFSALVSMFPQSFRSRSGSLTPALCLLTFLWLGVTVTTLFSFLGRH
jgi:hypothetical protein